MSNSKDNNKTGKSSFNKSKSKFISSAMDDLEMGRPISKPNFEIEDDFVSGLEEPTNVDDLESVPEITEEPKSNKTNYDDLSSFLDEDDEEDLESEDLEINGIDLKSEDLKVDDELESEDLDIEDDIFISPNKVSESLDLDDDIDDVESYFISDDDLNLSKPTKKSSSKSSKFISKPKKSSKKSTKKSFNKFKFNFSNKFKIFQGIKLSRKSKIFTFLGLIIGLIFIIYGIMNFNNVSDRVIDHVLLGEAGSWSIIMILIGLIIILLDVFYVFYYAKSVKTSEIKNVQIRNTFDTIGKIKSIDSDYYQNEDNDSILKNILKFDDEESSEDVLKSSDFTEDEIYVDQSVRDLDGLNSNDGTEEFDDFDSIDVSDSNNVDSLDDESSIFGDKAENLSDAVDDEIIQEIEEKSDKESIYDDLSSFLDEDDDEDTFEFKKSVDIDSVIKETKPKSTQDEDLAAKKARIIEGTNFDNSLRKSKK